MTPEETVNAFIERIVSKDIDGACEYVTADVEYDNVPMGKNIGPEGIHAILDAMTAVDEVQFVIHHQVVSGNTIMNERVDRFRLGESWVDLPVAGLFVVNDDGLITLWRDYFDLATMTDQFAALGVDGTA